MTPDEPVSAVQDEYSLWRRRPEKTITPVFAELSLGLVPYTPWGEVSRPEPGTRMRLSARETAEDSLPRFTPEALGANMAMVDLLKETAENKRAVGTMGLLEVLKQGRSIKKYTPEKIPQNKITRILQAGLLSASSRSVRPREFIVVRNESTLKYLAECRDGGHAEMPAEADCAIIVVAEIKDCSVAMANTHLMADSLGVGNCRIQGIFARSTVWLPRNICVKTAFSRNLKITVILSLGLPEASPDSNSMDNLHWEKVNRDSYQKKQWIQFLTPPITSIPYTSKPEQPVNSVEDGGQPTAHEYGADYWR